jgi:FSR family fosmidomycin resistance protein-like MFS transporter
MATSSDRLTLFFSSLGHMLMHMLAAFFFVVVLTLEGEWDRPYHELIELWTLGALLIGLAALPAGWLADRWSAPGMIATMFVGMGVACFICSAADSPTGLFVGLSVLGVFASIYHPVGIPWIVRSTRASGRALGINGVFGGLGVALSGAVAGLLIDSIGWRAAFAIPGIVSVLSGVALAVCLRAGLLHDTKWIDERPTREGRNEMLRGFLLLLFTMFSLGFVFHASQIAFPKMFDLRLGSWLGKGALGVGLVVTAVYTIGSLMQLAGGYLADRFPLKRVYLGSLILQAPALTAVAVATGLPLVVSAAFAVLLSTAALPSENLLLARYSPQRHQGLAFGLKFVLAFGAGPLAIAFVSRVTEATGGFTQVFMALAGMAAVACLTASALPSVDRPESEPQPISAP